MFRWLCGALAQSLGEGCGHEAPAWPEDPADVETLVTLAGHHFVTPALARALQGNAGVPPQLGDYFEAALYLNRERNAVILDALETAARALAARGIVPILLKGAANLADGLYPDPAIRIANDLDLLVSAESAGAASAALAEAGFDDFEGGNDAALIYARHHHLPPQRHRDTGVGIELHRAVLEAPYGRLLDAERMRRAARPVAFRGQRLALPSPTHRVLHNIVHDQLVDGAYLRRGANLRRSLDLSLLCRRYGDSIDWDELGASFGLRHARVLRYSLGLTELFGASPPIGSLPKSLRRLRPGVEHPRSLLRLKLRRAALRFIRRPGTLVNLMRPETWPERRRRWIASATPPRA
jgi:hypothetical protein